MTDRQLDKWCSKIIEARMARDYKREKRLDRKLTEILAKDSVKEERKVWLVIISVIAVLITLSIVFAEFILVALMAVPFIAQALKDGGDIK